jgi:hypothetical protein
MLLEKAAELQRRGIFLGGPKRKFIPAGRGQFELLLTHGMVPESRLLDVGCGALRGGWWSINFLRPNRYFGIEPNAQMLDAGKEVMLGAELLEEKQPAFSNTPDFNFSLFGEKFDFVIARSIWTHASQDHIRTMLEQFKLCSTPRSVFLASIKPPKTGESEYTGKEWRGRSHENEDAAMAHYTFATVQKLCAENDLTAEDVGTTDQQLWCKIRHAEN